MPEELPTAGFLTVNQVAAQKSVSAAAVYAAITEGRLAAERVLNRWAVRPEAVEAWKPRAYGERVRRRGDGPRERR